MTDKQFIRRLQARGTDQQVRPALELLAEQLHDGWRQLSNIKIPATYCQVKNVAICGMGGSHLGADICRAIWSDRLSVPINVISDYQLPRWVNRQSLVICSSYSGSTEETIAALTMARQRGAKIIVIASGGQLIKRAGRVPIYRFNPTANPSGQPRLGIGYSLAALLSIFRRLGWITHSQAEHDRLVATAHRASQKYGPRHTGSANQAIHLARAWDGGVPLLIGAEWTAGNLQTFQNQIHENAKTFAAFFMLPDLNHHLLEGLRNRRLNRQIRVLTIDDQTYQPRNYQRLQLTKKILTDAGCQVDSFKPHGHTNLEKAIDLLTFGGYVSWYLAVVRGVRPAPIPTVDFLKAQLAKH